MLIEVSQKHKIIINVDVFKFEFAAESSFSQFRMEILVALRIAI